MAIGELSQWNMTVMRRKWSKGKWLERTCSDLSSAGRAFDCRVRSNRRVPGSNPGGRNFFLTYRIKILENFLRVMTEREEFLEKKFFERYIFFLINNILRWKKLGKKKPWIFWLLDPKYLGIWERFWIWQFNQSFVVRLIEMDFFSEIFYEHTYLL